MHHVYHVKFIPIFLLLWITLVLVIEGFPANSRLLTLKRLQLAVAEKSSSSEARHVSEATTTATTTTSLTYTTDRRQLFESIPAVAVALTPFPPVAPAFAATTATNISVPLEYIPALGGYVVHYYLFGERFGAVVDTGSPFLTVPSTCNKWAYKYKWGCYKPELTKDSGYSNTVEGFNSNQGTVVWRKAGFSFEENDNDHGTPMDELVFGVFGPDLLDGPGGVFLGLIKETAGWIRPSFLSQTSYQSFCVDLRPNETKLVLSQQPMIQDDGEDYIPLVTDLYRRYKAPVVHYTAKASSFVVNGLPLRLNDNGSSNTRMPTYVIFDTGVTGMVVSQELYDGRYLQARKNKEKSLWGHVTVTFATKSGQQLQLSANKPITTPLGKANPFRRFKGNLIVLGLAFLDGLAMTIDIEQGKLTFSE